MTIWSVLHHEIRTMTLEQRKPTCPSFFFGAMQWSESESFSSTHEVGFACLDMLACGQFDGWSELKIVVFGAA